MRDDERPQGPWDRPEDDASGADSPEPIFNPNAFEAWPVVLLTASFVAIHLYGIYGGPYTEMRLLDAFGFYANRFWDGRQLFGTLSSAFLHAGWLHLGMNSVAFFALGTMCWRMMGTSRFLVFFALTAIAGSIAFALVRPESGPLVGASGAIFGLLAAVKRVEFRLRANRGEDVRRQMLMFLGQMVALNLAIGLATFGIMAWEAHLGGMALGWVITPYMMQQGR